MQALELAREARKRDLTLLPAYLALGKAALANAQYAEAIQVLKTYVEYATNDADGWMALAQAYAGLSQPDEAYVEPSRKPDEQDYEVALEAFDRAIELNEELRSCPVPRLAVPGGWRGPAGCERFCQCPPGWIASLSLPTWH